MNSVSIVTLLTQSLTSSLDLQSSIAQMRFEGSKIWVYIVIIGGGTLKGHQINGSLPLGQLDEVHSSPTADKNQSERHSQIQ